jgi:predicted kinase
MLVGVPGSGKSTWIKHNFEGRGAAEGLHIASTDDWIESAAKLTGSTYNEMFKSSIKEAEKLMYSTLEIATKAKMDIIWDQTNLTRKSRAKKLIMIPDIYQKIAVFFPTPDNIWERLIHREMAEDKSIPESIVQSMIGQLQFPSADEGFDRVITAR